jgi:RNA polymerase sigma-70 factor, ECF subfamily
MIVSVMETAVRKLGTEPIAQERNEPLSFDELYAQHFKFVWRNLRRLGVPEALVEDAAQDTFVVVLRRITDLRPDASARGWLFAIALRVARDYRRTAQRKPVVSLDVERHASCDRSPFESAAQAQAGRVLERFLDTLDEARRVVFVLADLEDMTAPEIADSLGVPVNTVYSRLRSARERFVEFLEAEGSARG